VSLDISNAFNILPWECIKAALRYHRVPRYLRYLIGDYLRDRTIEYTGRYKMAHRRDMERGVPQGSVLGPLLWNLGYDWELRGALFTGLGVVYYADDTLVMARGDGWQEAARRAEAGMALVVRRMEMLRLKVVAHKTEAIGFHGPRSKPPAGFSIYFREVRVEVGSHMKYLGLVLDSRWTFGEHFARLGPRLRGEVAGLARLLPNLGGPGEGVRCLYAAVVRSIALYGAPHLVEGPEGRQQKYGRSS